MCGKQQSEQITVNKVALAIGAEPIPLQPDTDGVLRVGGTRVTLDTIVAAFEEGATAEEIVYQYPSLRLADVYSVIGYYLQRHLEVEAYLQRQAAEVRQGNKMRREPRDIRERLLARRARRMVVRPAEAMSYATAGR